MTLLIYYRQEISIWLHAINTCAAPTIYTMTYADASNVCWKCIKHIHGQYINCVLTNTRIMKQGGPISILEPFWHLCSSYKDTKQQLDNPTREKLQWNLSWKTAPVGIKIWSLKIGGLWWQFVFHLCWNAVPTAKKLVIPQDRSLMAVVSPDSFTVQAGVPQASSTC